LGKLGKQAADLDPSLEPHIDQIVDLTKYAWMFRYPGDPAGPATDDVADALLRARRVIDQILSRLPPELRAIS
jgi:hypothetical protein